MAGKLASLFAAFETELDHIFGMGKTGATVRPAKPAEGTANPLVRPSLILKHRPPEVAPRPPFSALVQQEAYKRHINTNGELGALGADVNPGFPVSDFRTHLVDARPQGNTLTPNNGVPVGYPVHRQIDGPLLPPDVAAGLGGAGKVLGVGGAPLQELQALQFASSVLLAGASAVLVPALAPASLTPAQRTEAIYGAGVSADRAAAINANLQPPQTKLQRRLAEED